MLLQIRAIARARGIGPSDVGVFPIYVGLQNEKAYPHEGRLDFVDTGINPSTGTLQVRAVLPNTDRALLPGAFVRVRMPIDRNDKALVVSNRALGVDQTGTYVLLVNADDVVEQRAVETGALVDEMRVITKGLAVTDRVIVDGLQRAIPGIKVAVRENVTAGAPPPAGAAASTPSKPR